MRAIWCCGDGFGPLHEVQNESEINMTEEVSSAAGSPKFRDQCAASETGDVGAEVIEDLVNDLDGDADRASIALRRGGCELAEMVGTTGDSRWEMLACPLVSTMGVRKRDLGPPFSVPQHGFIARLVIKSGVNMTTFS